MVSEDLADLSRLIDVLGPALVATGRGLEACRPPADTREIEGWERRVGQRLPPSYRIFLSLHDGWEVYKDGWTLIGAAEEAFASARADAALTLREHADAWRQTYGEPTSEAVSRYEACRSMTNPAEARGPIYAANKIAVGTDFNGGVVLLNPDVRDRAGDFEAVRFSSRFGVIGRYSNFCDLLRADLAELRDSAA